MSHLVSKYKMVCPDCKQAMRVRNSEGLSELVRTAYLQCTNLGCGATFRAMWEITHRLSPPAQANPLINLPDADWAMRNKVSKEPDDNQMDIDELLNSSHSLK